MRSGTKYLTLKNIIINPEKYYQSVKKGTKSSRYDLRKSRSVTSRLESETSEEKTDHLGFFYSRCGSRMIDSFRLHEGSLY